MTPIASTSKALATVALLVLADQDMIDLDQRVATYWPAFAQSGKSDIPVHLVASDSTTTRPRSTKLRASAAGRAAD
jgi:CubicO group peptidase (beta-lactamase class C family)